MEHVDLICSVETEQTSTSLCFIRVPSENQVILKTRWILLRTHLHFDFSRLSIKQKILARYYAVIVLSIPSTTFASTNPNPAPFCVDRSSILIILPLSKKKLTINTQYIYWPIICPWRLNGHLRVSFASCSFFEVKIFQGQKMWNKNFRVRNFTSSKILRVENFRVKIFKVKILGSKFSRSKF